ncbi:hypothetical protein D9Q98_006244 [Chlorella vulgaris]|uniref:Dolichol kinase n=1 Tax=Chlorella vulgaris TaxID=3077 RepID=A0A9D4TXD0_CHLVU|nr:hypothetical protein D9Q98_006244 [Chlorella vulgaris]
MLCWPLYSAAPSSRWLAASVPALAGVQFGLVGAGLIENQTLVAGSSRSGRAEELLRGPLLYAVVHVAVTLLCWRHSPGGVLALSALCGGDGLAEVVGRGCSSAAARAPAGTSTRGDSWRRRLLTALARPMPHNSDKTVAGTLACWLGGAAVGLPLLLHFQRCGMFGPAALGGWALVRGVLLCSAVGAVAESLPLGADTDNATIVVAVALASRAFFGY